MFYFSLNNCTGWGSDVSRWETISSLCMGPGKGLGEDLKVGKYWTLSESGDKHLHGPWIRCWQRYLRKAWARPFPQPRRSLNGGIGAINAHLYISAIPKYWRCGGAESSLQTEYLPPDCAPGLVWGGHLSLIRPASYIPGSIKTLYFILFTWQCKDFILAFIWASMITCKFLAWSWTP